jgi:hypothetical protein
VAQIGAVAGESSRGERGDAASESQLMSDLTIHGAQRVRQRGGARAGDELRLLDSMWAGGREAIAEDFVSFRATQQVGRVYRVTVKGGRAYLIIKSMDGSFITLFRK